MLEQPGRTQIRSDNFTAKRPGIAGWQPTLCSRAANQHPLSILQRILNESLAADLLQNPRDTRQRATADCALPVWGLSRFLGKEAAPASNDKALRSSFESVTLGRVRCWSEPMETRAAVAHKAGQNLTIETVQLDGPKAGEVLVEI